MYVHVHLRNGLGGGVGIGKADLICQSNMRGIVISQVLIIIISYTGLNCINGQDSGTGMGYAHKNLRKYFKRGKVNELEANILTKNCILCPTPTHDRKRYHNMRYTLRREHV